MKAQKANQQEGWQHLFHNIPPGFRTPNTQSSSPTSFPRHSLSSQGIVCLHPKLKGWKGDIGRGVMWLYRHYRIPKTLQVQVYPLFFELQNLNPGEHNSWNFNLRSYLKILLWDVVAFKKLTSFLLNQFFFKPLLHFSENLGCHTLWGLRVHTFKQISARPQRYLAGLATM